MAQWKVHQVAVIGSGIMGSQIAAQFAAANTPVLLFDLPGETQPNALVQKNLQHLKVSSWNMEQ